MQLLLGRLPTALVTHLDGRSSHLYAVMPVRRSQSSSRSAANFGGHGHVR